MSSKPKTPPKTAEEFAVERRTRTLLDKEIEEQEEAFKALARGKLGRASLLSGAPASRAKAAGGSRSMLGGASAASSGSYGTGASTSSGGGGAINPSSGGAGMRSK